MTKAVFKRLLMHIFDREQHLLVVVLEAGRREANDLVEEDRLVVEHVYCVSPSRPRSH